MSELKVLTFEGTTNSARYDMTVEIPEGATMILKQARFEITHAAAGDYPRVVNVGIGSTVNTNFVIDNDAGYNYFKVGLDYNSVNIGGTLTNISVTYPDTGYKMSGRLDKNCVVSLFNSAHAPLPNLVYYFLQFVVV